MKSVTTLASAMLIALTLAHGVSQAQALSQSSTRSQTSASATTAVLTLSQAWSSALAHGPQQRSMEATQALGSAQADLARSLWRPVVGVQSQVGRGSVDSRIEGASFSTPAFGSSRDVAFATSVNAGTATRWGVGARQPLWSGERAAQAEQLRVAARAAEVDAQQQRQDWMQAMARQYLALGMGQRQVRLVEQQLMVVRSAAEQAQDRYTLGASPVTDVHEAQARLQALQALLVSARAEAVNARAALVDAVGGEAGRALNEGMEVLLPVADGPVLEGTLDGFLEQARRTSPWMRGLQARWEQARAEVLRHRLEGSVSVDLVAQAARDRLQGSGDFGSSATVQRQAFVGVQLSVPLSTGGARQAQESAAQAQERRARAEWDAAQLQLAAAVRRAWWQVQSSEERVRALGAAVKASAARRDATQLGKQVGDRTTLDVLNAVQDEATQEWQWLQARADAVLARQQLWALTGMLDDACMAELDRFFSAQ